MHMLSNKKSQPGSGHHSVHDDKREKWRRREVFVVKDTTSVVMYKNTYDKQGPCVYVNETLGYVE
jgi:hypothetical protein